jgi:hypothetical protein
MFAHVNTKILCKLFGISFTNFLNFLISGTSRCISFDLYLRCEPYSIFSTEYTLFKFTVALFIYKEQVQHGITRLVRLKHFWLSTTPIYFAVDWGC